MLDQAEREGKRLARRSSGCQTCYRIVIGLCTIASIEIVALKKKYRSVPLICPPPPPPILYTTSCLKWGRGLYSRMQLVSTISPPPQKDFTQALCTQLGHFQSSCLHIRTQLTNYGDDFQDREYCSRTSRLQSCVVSLHRRRAASSTRGQ